MKSSTCFGKLLLLSLGIAPGSGEKVTVTGTNAELCWEGLVLIMGFGLGGVLLDTGLSQAVQEQG